MNNTLLSLEEIEYVKKFAAICLLKHNDPHLLEFKTERLQGYGESKNDTVSIWCQDAKKDLQYTIDVFTSYIKIRESKVEMVDIV